MRAQPLNSSSTPGNQTLHLRAPSLQPVGSDRLQKAQLGMLLKLCNYERSVAESSWVSANSGSHHPAQLDFSTRTAGPPVPLAPFARATNTTHLQPSHRTYTHLSTPAYFPSARGHHHQSHACILACSLPTAHTEAEPWRSKAPQTHRFMHPLLQYAIAARHHNSAASQ